MSKAKSSKAASKEINLPKAAGKETTGSKALKPKVVADKKLQTAGEEVSGEGKAIPFNTEASPMKLAKPAPVDPVEGPYKSPTGEEKVAESKTSAKKGKGALQYGNQDKEKKYDLSRLNVPDDHVVVRHFGTVDLANGQKMEDPSSSRFQVYDKNTFDSLSKQGVANGKQTASQFEVLGLNHEVLHMPK